MTIYHSSHLGIASRQPEAHTTTQLDQSIYGTEIFVALTIFSAVTALLHLAARHRWRKRENTLLDQLHRLSVEAEALFEYTKYQNSNESIRIFLTKETSQGIGLGPEICVPPALAERLLRFVTKPRYQESLIGDRAERFKREVEKYGLKRARHLYWTDTWHSLWPLLSSSLKRWGVVSAIIGSFHYLFGK